MQPTDVCSVISGVEALKQSTPVTPAATIGSGSGVHRGQTTWHSLQSGQDKKPETEHSTHPYHVSNWQVELSNVNRSNEASKGA